MKLYPRMRERPPEFRINPASPLYDGLVLACLGQHAGAGYMYDSSPYGNHGVFENKSISQWQWHKDLSRYVLRFNGASGERVNVGDAKGTDSLQQLSIAVWFAKDVGVGGDRGIVEQYDWGEGVNDGFLMRISNVSTLRFGIIDHVAFPEVQATITDDGSWHHAVGIWSGTEEYLYVNGVLRATRGATANLSYIVNPLIIGASSDLVWNFFIGLIGDPMIWRRALSDSEGKALADPGNVDLRVGGVPLILPPRRRSWPGITITTQDEVITLPTLLAEC
ncbi:MAG: hypothetical protein KatS3mg038_2815 [Candidatus Kapaibacterium sp.]|nr:MAG: hypothetical protein KatS3mg038_2815 [Candidatus Kapabacteria bacterium]